MPYKEWVDAMGPVQVPETAYYGPQTQRAVDNFPISGITLPPDFIRPLALIKKCAAHSNHELGLIDGQLAEAISRAAAEIMDGRFDDQFVVDVFQTGSGTSTNMNMNEVIALRANELLTGARELKKPVHPNDHVNLGQSSNDVIPTCIHVAACIQTEKALLPALHQLKETLDQKASEFKDIPKIGRTHLQDAVPMHLGEEFSGYARQVELGIARIISGQTRLRELALGGTAVGTGQNTHPEFAASVIQGLSQTTGIAFTEAANHFEAQAARDAAVDASGQLRTLAVSLVKIANDIRWLSSGPRCGIGEITLPSLQPGSSIMPGKVNPVIPEAVLQVAAQVIGNDTAIMLGGQGGNFELNVMMPLIAHNLLQSIKLLSSAAKVFTNKCIRGISANRSATTGYIEKSLALVTALVPHIGYDQSARLAQIAHETGATIKAIAKQEKVLPDDLLDELL